MDPVDTQQSAEARSVRYLGVAGLLLVLAGVLVVVFLPRGGATPRDCPLRTLAGIPCPFCGGTRAVAAVASGEVVEAVRFNPMVVAGLMLVMSLGAVAVLAPHRVQTWARSLTCQSRPAGIAAVALLILNWIYLIASGR